MSQVLEAIVPAAEILAVLLAFGYVLLAARQSIWCWPMDILSALLFMPVFYTSDLFMLCLLQSYYVAIGIYGWMHWHNSSAGETTAVRRWQFTPHLLAVATGLATTLILLWLQWADVARWHLMAVGDALVSAFSIVAMWMMSRKILHAWVYWMLINLVSIGLFSLSELWPTAGLYVIYLGMSWYGHQQWSQHSDMTN